MRIVFGDCAFDSETRELFRGGNPVHLSPKAFRLLELLLENRPRALSKQELQEKLWPRTFVSEANLASLAAEARRAIGDTARGSRLLRTVYGFGYAFSGEGRAEERPALPLEGARHRILWEEREFPLGAGENILGRDAGIAVRIDDSTVSRRHARIHVADSQASIEDLESKNGTFVSGRRVRKPCRLSDGDEIQMGSVFLTFRMESPEQSTRTVHEEGRGRRRRRG